MRRWLNASLYIYMLLDVAVTNVAFGFYTDGWKFDKNVFFDTITFSKPYNFTTSPYEFQILSFIRQAFCVIAVTAIILDKTEKVKNLLTLVVFNSVFTYSFSLVKFLAFAEVSEQLYFPGVWISVLWSILSGLIQILVWYFVLTTHPFDYRQLINTSGIAEETDAESTAEAASANTVENGKQR